MEFSAFKNYQEDVGAYWKDVASMLQLLCFSLDILKIVALAYFFQ